MVESTCINLMDENGSVIFKKRVERLKGSEPFKDDSLLLNWASITEKNRKYGVRSFHAILLILFYLAGKMWRGTIKTIKTKTPINQLTSKPVLV